MARNTKIVAESSPLAVDADKRTGAGGVKSRSWTLLIHCTGQIRIGVSEDILVYPDEPDADMYWVKFDDDTQPIRQIKGSWLVKAADLQG